MSTAERPWQSICIRLFGALVRMCYARGNNLKAQFFVLSSKAKTIEVFEALLPFSSLSGKALNP
jgi:hypothetical protein